MRDQLAKFGGSPSEKAYADLIAKIQSRFFQTSHDWDHIKNNPLARKAYNL